MGISDKARVAARAVPWLLPAGPVKNRILNAMGHEIAEDASVAPCVVVRVKHVRLASGAKIAAANVLKDLEVVDLDEGSYLGGFNLVSAAPTFAENFATAGELRLGECAVITSRHSLDCSGNVIMGDFSLLAGHGTQVLSHSIDLRRNAQSAKPVIIGDRTFVGTRCVLLGGADVPRGSVVAAGSVVTGGGHDDGSLIAGVPAKSKMPIEGEWFEREVDYTNDVYDPSADRTIPKAF